MNIEIRDLYKNYGKKEALKGINLDIESGMFGLLGPNGAGKTTLMRILATLIDKTSGGVVINGVDIKNKARIREQIGYLPQDFSMYPSMTVYESMDYLAILSDITPSSRRRELILDILDKVNLFNNLRTKVRALSGGMKRRLGITQAIIHDPKVLIIDEPTAGLDPEERIRFRNLLSDFSRGRIVILSTHIVEDIESTCENLAVIRDGSVVFNGKSKELTQGADKRVWTAVIPKEEYYNSVKDRRDIKIISTITENGEIRARILSESKPMDGATAADPSIEDGYMNLIWGEA
jgi:ABC-2 type transport system ATP-binding protein